MTTANNLSSIQLTQKTTNQNALQNGSNVFVRVLSKDGGSAYTVSFAGGKFSVFSEKSLEPGTNFKALVTIKNGKLFLSPHIQDAKNTLQSFSIKDGSTQAQLETVFQNLGLKPDVLSLRIVQFFQSAGMSFNANLAAKARRLGLMFVGKEKEATEIALFLEQRGINADSDVIAELLSLLFRDDSLCEREDHPFDKHKGSERVVPNILLESLYTKPIEILQKQIGLLSFINHTAAKPMHWIVLPFEIGANGRGINGSIRLLLNLDKKIIEKIVIFSFISDKNSNLMVYCNRCDIASNNAYTIQFSVDTPCTEQEKQNLEELLMSFLPKDGAFSVEYSDSLFDDGVFTVGSSIAIVEVDA